MSTQYHGSIASLFGGTLNLDANDILPIISDAHARIAYGGGDSPAQAAAQAFAAFDDELPKTPRAVALFFTVPESTAFDEITKAVETLTDKLGNEVLIVFGCSCAPPEITGASAVIIAAKFE
jgi:cell division GTPase FtsZ